MSPLGFLMWLTVGFFFVLLMILAGAGILMLLRAFDDLKKP